MANRYWVGGSGTWDGTALLKWASTSGGVGGQPIPSTGDDVYFDAASGTVAILIGASVCRNLTFTGFTGSLTATGSTLSCFGSLTMFPITSAWTGVINFLATTPQTITSNGFTFNNPLTFSGVGGSWQLIDDVTTGATRTVTLTNGTLNLNNKNLTTGVFSSNNTNTRSVAYGTGKIVLTGNNTTIWSCGDLTNFSYTGTPTVESSYSGATGTRTFASGGTAGGTEFNVADIKITAGTDIITIGGNGSVRNLDFTGFSGSFANIAARTIYGNLTISSGMTVTSGSGVLTFAATSGTKTITTNNKTINNPLTFNGIGGTFAFQDALTQGSTRAFTITNGTVQLKSGVTSTVGSFATSTTNQKFLQSTTAGTQATFSQVTGIVSTGYLTIKDINATGGATFNAYTVNSNVNAGNNLGWDFFAQLGKAIFTRRKEKRVLI